MYIHDIVAYKTHNVRLESAETLVAIGETAELTADYMITEPGEYMVTGHVSYDGKNTTEGNVSFTALVGAGY